MMVRFLNLASILVLLASSIFAYAVKYQTIFYAEQIAKLSHKMANEEDKIAELRAQWAQLTAPTRIRELSDRFLDLQPMALSQIASMADLPEPSRLEDSIGKKIGELGLMGQNASSPSIAAPSTPPHMSRRAEPVSATRAVPMALQTATPH